MAGVASFAAQDQGTEAGGVVSIGDFSSESVIKMNKPYTENRAWPLLLVKHGGRLVTFDANISLSAVHGAKKQHVLAL